MMSLYYEAASLIISLGNSQDASLKSLLFSKTRTNGEQVRKSNPTQLYALITESWKWSSILKDIIERAGLLSQERKLSPQLALVLVHDLLFAKKGIAAPESHVLRKAIERHKARLRAELSKARIRAGCTSIEDLKLKFEQQNNNEETEPSVGTETGIREVNKKWPHPRWLRINTLRASLNLLQSEEFLKWKKVNSLAEILSFRFSNSGDRMIYFLDKSIPNLLAFPPATDLSSLPAYARGELISQDKASCFPAFLLSSGDRVSGGILDACAAPGNKTSHIAAIVSEQGQNHKSKSIKTEIHATERNPQRAEVLKKMLKIAGADDVVIHAGQDFFKLDTNEYPWNEISVIILDPSCSGSGIVDRGQTMTFDLPSATSKPNINGSQSQTNDKKRKRRSISNQIKPQNQTHQAKVAVGENDVEIIESNTKELQARLKSLAALQTKMLTFAFSFPKLQRITYSTCSIHATENESVVVAALGSDVAKSRGWRIMKREEQVEGLKQWAMRGEIEECRSAMATYNIDDLDPMEIAEACIRCEPFTVEGTQGFFVAGFVRDMSGQDSNGLQRNANIEEEWQGFDN